METVRRSTSFGVLNRGVSNDSTDFDFRSFERDSEIKANFIADQYLHDEVQRKFMLERLSGFATCERKDAESILLRAYSVSDNKNGLYLLRPCSKSSSDLVLSAVCNGRVFHYRMACLHDIFFAIDRSRTFSGVEKALEHFKTARTLACLLTDPVGTEPIPLKYRLYGINSLLHKACLYGRLDIVEKVFSSETKIDVNERNQVGDTALHIAASYGHNEIVNVLLRNGASMSKSDEDGFSALHRAAINNNPTTMLTLVDAGADINAINQRKSSALHEAAKLDCFACVSLLLELGAPPNPRDENGHTPLELAIARGATESVEILNKFKWTDVGTKRDHWYHGPITKPAAMDLLKKHGQENGSFLVRQKTNGDEFVLSVNGETGLYNYEIKKDPKGLYSICDGPLFDSLEHVVHHYSRHRDRLAAKLGKPINPQSQATDNINEKPAKQTSDLFRSRSLKYSGSQKSFTSSESSADLSKVHRYITRFNSVAPQPRERLSIRKDLIQPDGVPIIPRSSLEFHKKLGEGQFGIVYEGAFYHHTSHSPTPIAVAIKKLKSTTPETIREFTREASIMYQLRHHCIVKIYGIVNEKSFMMVNELLPHGALINVLRKKTYNVTIDHIKKWAMQIAHALDFMESKQFVHRDLAARNVLVASYNQVKVTDFGLSRSTVNDIYEQHSNDKIPIKWYAPEAIEFGRFTSKSDVWSYGITLWEMFSYGKEPYKDMIGIEVYDFIKKGKRLGQPTLCPKSTYRIMLNCWKEEEVDRPTFNSLVKYFANDNQFRGLDRILPPI